MSSKPYYPLDNNNSKIEEIFGRNFLEKSRKDKLSVEESLEANEYLMEVLYGKELANLIKDRNYEKVKELYLSMYSSHILPREITQDINIDEVGIIMVRPETMGLCDKYEELISSKGLQIIFDKVIPISFEQYWILYQHGLIHYDCRYDFPTRTFNYVDNNCKMYVVTSSGNITIDGSISDYIRAFKGKHGRYTPNTLRGDIAYNGLKDYIAQKNTFVEEANIALDPIGMYRAITRGQVDYDRAHEVATLPLLFYAGQAVHTPEDSEIQRDFRALCTVEDANEIKAKVLQLKR